MKLYNKTLLIVIIVVSLMFLLMYGVSQIVLMGSFDRLDEQYSIENVEIATNALNETMNKLDSTTGDWAQWDDVYFFVNDPNENFSNAYLNADTTTILKVNLMLFMELSGKIVGGVAFDLENKTEVPVPRHFSQLSNRDVLFQHQGVKNTIKGIILLPEGPMLLSSWPVTNNGKLPSGGTIIMGRYLDESEIKRLSEITHLSLAIQRLDDVRIPSDYQVALSFLSRDNPIFIQQLSDKSIAGYTLLNDIYGNPAIILKAESSRVVHAQGKETIYYLILLLVIIGIIFVAVFLFLLKNYVLSRLANLDAQVQAISRNQDTSSGVQMESEGTLSAGHRSINRIMNSLTLRSKTLLIMGVVFLIMIIPLITASQVIVMDRFTRLEEQYTHQKSQFIRDTLNDDLYKLDTTEEDWASWDDTYIFVNDSNEEYIRSNLGLEIFTNLNLNLMLFMNSSGNMVYGKVFDLENKAEVPVPRYFKENLSPDDYLLQHPGTLGGKKGIILIPEGPLLVASQPILQNSRIGPARGTMIMGRFLDLAQIKRLSGITHFPLSTRLFYDKQMPSDFQAVIPFFSGDESIYVRPVSQESIAGYTLLNDIYGKPGIILKVELPREIYKQGKETLGYFIFSILIICLVFSIMIVVLLERFVLRRLHHFDYEVKNIEKSGNISSRVVIEGKDELSNLAGSLNNMLDALEQSREKVSKSEVENRAILEAIPDSILQVRKNGTILNYKAAKDKQQIPFSQDIIGRNIQDILPQNVAGQIMDHIQQTLLTKEKQLFQFQLIEKSNIFYYEVRTVVFAEDEVLAIITDIIERRRAEGLLNKSKEFAETVLNSMKDAISIIDVNNFRIIDVNSVFLKIYGMKKEDVIGKNCYAITHKRDQPCIPPDDVCPLIDTLNLGKHSTAEHLHYMKDGEKRYVEVSTSPIIDENGKIVNVIHVTRDISERKEMEDTLRRNEEYFRSLIENALDTITVLDTEGIISYQSPSVERVLGYKPEELNGKSVFELIHPDDSPGVISVFNQGIQNPGSTQSIESRFRHKDGSWRILESKGKAIIGNKELIYVIVNSREITDRKQAEEALRLSLSLLNATLESTADGILVVDRNRHIMRWNQKFAEMWQIPQDVLSGHSDEQALNYVLQQLAHPEEFLAKVRELYGQPEATSFDQLNLEDGRIFERYSQPQKIGNDIVGRVWSFRDITRSKRAEEKIAKSLVEKEVLLREIHHRVKNNMQIVSSLLMLQSNIIEDKKYKDIFIESQTRIYSMALIHEKLYQSESIAQINFKEYIDGIISNIFESYCLRSNIRIDINVENIPIKIDYAVPCGLIINELVTNIIKYAFPDGRQGKIKISVKSYDDNMIRLSVSDDGIGIAKDMDIRNTKSLGLHLVTALAEGQLHGEIILNRDSGTEFQINFKQEK